MNKKLLLVILVGLGILFGGVFVFSKITENNDAGNNGTILFYGNGCPHCAKVEEYIEANKVEDKIQFSTKEVFSFWHKKNAQLLMEKAASCGLSTDGIGVPFLWDGSRCLVGDQDIINFFKEKIGG